MLVALTCLTWALIVCSEFLLVFLSLMLVFGWSNLIVQHTVILNRLRNPYRWAVSVLALYSPVVIAIGIKTFTRFDQDRLMAPFLSLSTFNIGPLWWIIGLSGFLVMGLRVNTLKHSTMVYVLFLIAGSCYAVSILLSLEPLSHSSTFAVERSWEWLVLFLNPYMATAFLAATIYPTTFKSWRSILAALSSVLVATLMIGILASIYARPMD